jgi:hypothetical protein
MERKAAIVWSPERIPASIRARDGSCGGRIETTNPDLPQTGGIPRREGERRPVGRECEAVVKGGDYLGWRRDLRDETGWFGVGRGVT